MVLKQEDLRLIGKEGGRIRHKTKRELPPAEPEPQPQPPSMDDVVESIRQAASELIARSSESNERMFEELEARIVIAIENRPLVKTLDIETEDGKTLRVDVGYS